MTQVFIEVLNNAWITSLLILAVIVFRFLFRKAPKYINCILWGIVGLKLMIPIDVRSVFSLLPSGKTIETVSNGSSPVIVRTGIGPIDTSVNEYVSRVSQSQPATRDSMIHWMDIFSILWFVGIGVMLAYLIVSYLLMRKKVASSIVVDKGVSVCDEIHSPFLFGMIKPHIYLPSGLESGNREYVLSHERMHLKRGDHLWKLLGFLVLAAYWFHPLCWISYILLCKDIELACDEMVIKKKDVTWRANYCQALLECSVGNRKIIAVPLAFGEVSVKERVKRVLSYKRTKIGVVIAAIIICAGVAICFGTNPKEKTDASSNRSKNEAIQEVKDVDDNSIPATVPTVDLSAATGADGARLYYADEDTIIFGGCFGLFVYDTRNHKYIRSVDLKPIDCEDTQGDNACFVNVNKEGSEVYLQRAAHKDNMYVYHVKENKFTKEKYHLNENDLFSGVGEDLVSATFVRKSNGKKDECWLCNAWKTIGELGFKYPNDNDNVYPLFMEEQLQGASFWIPSQVENLEKAEITFNGIHYVCTDAKVLKIIEDGLQKGKKRKGLSGCPFDDVMYLTKKDGSVGMFVPAMDDCKACLMDDGWYELDDSMSISIYDMLQKGFFQKEPIKNVGYQIGSKYTQEDIDSAIEIIKKEFKTDWKGCSLKELYYAGDEISDNYKEFAHRYKADEVIVLLSSFDVDSSGEDGSLNPNSTYDRF